MNSRNSQKKINSEKRNANHHTYDLRIINAVRKLIHLIDADSKRIIALHEVTGPQLTCLILISENENITATAISEIIQLSTSTISGILERLEDKNLIIRERSKSDRRKVYLQTTRMGKDLAETCSKPLLLKFHEKLKQIPAKHQQILATSLERILEEIDISN